MLISTLLTVPLLFALICLLFPRIKWIGIISQIGLGVSLLIAASLVQKVLSDSPVDSGMWYVDNLSAIFIALIAGISFLVGLYALSYLKHEESEGLITLRDIRHYHVFIQLFLFTMLLVVTVDSLGLMWIAIETSTLASVYLVGFYKKEESLEASWKYVIICSVGIALAFMGVTLMYASSLDVFGDSPTALDWSALLAIAPNLDPALLKLSFIFIIAGYGTKAGLAPMHTWLPDAHSQAPSPVSAMLSALLLNCAMYGIIRFYIISEIAIPGFASSLMLCFGLSSLFIAAVFITITKDLKRLLAYSSIEHMGIIAIGLGIGGFWAIIGVMVHIVAHSITKSMLFLSAGDIVQSYGTRDVASISGLLQRLPFSGTVFTAGTLAIVGMPPFSIFIGEVLIIFGALQAGMTWTVAVFIGLLLIIFTSFTYRILPMVSRNDNSPPQVIKTPLLRSVPLSLLLIGTLLLGLFMPEILSDWFMEAGKVFGVFL